MAAKKGETKKKARKSITYLRHCSRGGRPTHSPLTRTPIPAKQMGEHQRSEQFPIGEAGQNLAGASRSQPQACLIPENDEQGVVTESNEHSDKHLTEFHEAGTEREEREERKKKTIRVKTQRIQTRGSRCPRK